MNKTRTIINQDIVKKLLLLSRKISQGQNQYEDVLSIKIPLVEEIGEELDYIILDYLGISNDDTTRDYCSEILNDFVDDERTIEELLDKLVNI